MCFSVLMSVYAKERPEWLRDALHSLVEQTLLPDEIVCVKDGPLPDELENALQDFLREQPQRVRIVALPKNVGLGLALRRGMEECRQDIIARMDSDDISLRDRFEVEFGFLSRNPDIDVVSSWVGVFWADANSPTYIRRGPTDHDSISRLARFRFPMNHPASMFRRNAVLSAGGYTDFRGIEDYHLWARLLMNGSRMACIPEVLYMLREGNELVNRRSGFRHARMQFRLHRELKRMGFLTFWQFVRNVMLRYCACLAPVSLLVMVRHRLGY